MLKVSLYSPLPLFQFWVINDWREEWRHGMTPGSGLLEQPHRCKALACFKVTLLKLGSLNLPLWFISLYSCWAGLESCVTLVMLFDLGCVWLYDFCDLGDAVWPWTCATLGHAVWPRCVWPWKCVRPRTCCVAQMCMALKMCATQDMLLIQHTHGALTHHETYTVFDFVSNIRTKTPSRGLQQSHV